jgi:hypothetical protein
VNDTAERREHLQMRMSGLTRAVGDMEPGAREFCLAAIGEWADYTGELRDRVAELEAALNRAGDRLAQVQPGVTESWAFDIVPKAEQEIAEVLK